jgi:DNA-binding transcriptional regulator YiaG
MKGDQIKKIREEFDISTSELATLIGVQTSSVYRWEAAGRKVTKVEGLPKKLFELMSDLQQKERETVVKALRRGGWMLGLNNLLAISLKNGN